MASCEEHRVSGTLGTLAVAAVVTGLRCSCCVLQASSAATRSCAKNHISFDETAMWTWSRQQSWSLLMDRVQRMHMC